MAIKYNGKYGFIDQSGEIAIDPVFIFVADTKKDALGRP